MADSKKSKSDMKAQAFDRWENEGGKPVVAPKNESKKLASTTTTQAPSSNKAPKKK